MNRPNHQLELLEFISARQSIEDRSKLRSGLIHEPKIEDWEYFDIIDKIRFSRYVDRDNKRYSQYWLSIHHTGEELTERAAIRLMNAMRDKVDNRFGYVGYIQVLLTGGLASWDLRYVGYPERGFSGPLSASSYKRSFWDYIPFAEGNIEESYPVLSEAAFEEIFLSDARKEIDERVLYNTRNNRSAE